VCGFVEGRSSEGVANCQNKMWFLSHVNCCWWYLNVLLPLTGRKLQNKPNDFTYVHQIELHVIQRCLNEILTGVRKHDCQHNSVNLKVKLFIVRLVAELSHFLLMMKPVCMFYTVLINIVITGSALSFSFLTI